jgi:phage shock protein A
MQIDEKQLLEEKSNLQKDFDMLSARIKKYEEETGKMKSNLNAVYGAIQLVDKLLKSADKNSMSAEKQKALEIATT